MNDDELEQLFEKLADQDNGDMADSMSASNTTRLSNENENVLLMYNEEDLPQELDKMLKHQFENSDEEMEYLQEQAMLSQAYHRYGYDQSQSMERLGERGSYYDDDDDLLPDEDNLNEMDEDDDDDDDCYLDAHQTAAGVAFKQAMPILAMQKKYASTGFLFNRYGGLDTIVEESQAENDEAGYTVANTNTISTENLLTSQLNEAVNRSIKGSASCFDLEASLRRMNSKFAPNVNFLVTKFLDIESGTIKSKGYFKSFNLIIDSTIYFNIFL